MFQTLKLWWHRWCVNSPDPSLRCAAAEALGDLGDTRAVKALTKALLDGDRRVRSAAAEALVDLRALEPLIQALREGDGDARFVATEALGRLGDPRAVEALIKELKDGDRSLQRAAAEALGSLGDARAVMPLLRTLRDPNSDVQSAAAEALGRLRDARAVEPIIQALGVFSPHVKRLAAEALGRLGDARAVEPLRKVLGDLTGEVRSAAASALARLGQPEWEGWVKGDNADFGRLGESGDARAVEPLIEALGYHGIRGPACEALGKLGDARAVEPLIEALGNAEDSERRAAAEALRRLGQPVWHGLVKGDNRDFTRLGESGDARAVKPLIMALERTHGDLQGAAAEALGKLGDSRAVAPLLKALHDCAHGRRHLDVSGCVRRAAAEALGKLGDAQAAGPLLSCLGDDVAGVRRTAAVALGRLGHPLWQGLVHGDDGDFFRLGESGDPQAILPLIRGLDQPLFDDRLRAAHALREIADRNPRILLDRWDEAARKVGEPRTHNHSDNTGPGASDCIHSDHTDRGIGLDFPDPPATVGSPAKPAGSGVMSFRCPKPGCGKLLKVSTAHAGKRANCPHCGTPVQVPRKPLDTPSAPTDF